MKLEMKIKIKILNFINILVEIFRDCMIECIVKNRILGFENNIENLDNWIKEWFLKSYRCTNKLCRIYGM